MCPFSEDAIQALLVLAACEGRRDGNRAAASRLLVRVMDSCQSLKRMEPGPTPGSPCPRMRLETFR